MQNSKTVKCQNCKKEFVIKPEDFAFYEKIKVPPPTWCPECRLIRRMTFRNERTLYRRKCDLCGKNILAIYSPDKPFTIYCSECWWSDKWNPIEYGRDYDFSKSVFLQFRELLERIPLIALSVTNLVNCDYCNVSANDKECYLISGSQANERVMFANRVCQVPIF
ncbi:MAG: hypothetical protein QMC93_02880 [Patescibacteria group bacterium]|nr:hypothetical protein [Patescibacteria group bacterium]